MKDMEFLKIGYISNKGIYNNIDTYENTLESFNEAIKKNLIINLKIRLTQDKILVVYNDSNLTRLMNLKDKISTTTYEELLYLNKYHIPTLNEVLKLINGKVPIIINPKGIDYKYYLLKELDKLLETYEGKFAILSNDPLIIKWFNKNKPEYIIGEILSGHYKSKFSLLNILTNFSIQTDFKSVNVEYFNIIKIKKLKEKSLVLSYVADTKEKFDIFKDVSDNLFIEKLFKE